MQPSSLYRTAVLAAALAGAATAPGFALGYDGLVAAVQGRDRELELLGIEEERALIAVKKAELDRDSPALSASTGSLGLELSGGKLYASASPQASLAAPGGAGLELSAPFLLAAGSGYGYAAPSLSLSLPILRKGDEAAVAAARAMTSYVAARYAHSKRRAEVEKAVAEALRDAAKAEAEAGTARRKVEVASLALEKAKKIDGAEPGGKTWLSLEREEKSAERAQRDAEAAYSRGLEKLAILSGLEPSADLIPAALPETSLGSSLPAAGSLASVRAAEAELADAKFAAGEAAKDKSLAFKLGGSYAAGASLESYSSTLTSGAELDAGLAWATEDISLSFGLGWRIAVDDKSVPGPTASLSIGWKPKPRGSAGLAARDRALSVAEAESKSKAALEAARGALRELEYRRADLEASAGDIAEDLAAAREELSVYGEWREKGAVTEAEYREVLAFAAEAESRARVAAAERIIWKLDLELLGAEQEGSPAEEGEK